MIHPGLAALKQWDREEYAAAYRARFSDVPTQNQRIIAGAADGKMPTPKLSNKRDTKGP